MADQFWLTREQLRRIAPFFPLSHGVPRVDEQRVVSGIIHVIRNGLRWRDAQAAHGPHKTLHNRIFAGLVGQAGEPERLMIDATHLRAHRTAATRYDRCAHTFMSAVTLAVTVAFWLKQ